MKYTFTEIKSINLPKTKTRSARTKKKLHIEEYKVYCVDIAMVVKGLDYNDKFDAIADRLEELEIDYETFSYDVGVFSIMLTYNLKDYSEQSVKDYCTAALYELTMIDVLFAEVQEINVTVGDAYYGDW